MTRAEAARRVLEGASLDELAREAGTTAEAVSRLLEGDDIAFVLSQVEYELKQLGLKINILADEDGTPMAVTVVHDRDH